MPLALGWMSFARSLARRARVEQYYNNLNMIWDIMDTFQMRKLVIYARWRRGGRPRK